ncbi:MAG: hypothetical protein HDKAJFGB_02328 [Anaerolineae bacterium]|nr:hypothetical protein [Anaerolineae bacterium]
MRLVLRRSLWSEILQTISKFLAKSPLGFQVESSPGRVRAYAVLVSQTLVYENEAPENTDGEGILHIPNDALRSLAASRGNEGTISVTATDGVTAKAEWRNKSLRSNYQFAAETAIPAPEIPGDEAFTPLDLDRFQTHFTVCAEVVTTMRTRFDLDCICLDGDKSQMLASDGRQLYLGNGIPFPWKGKCLLPVTPTFPDKVLFGGTPLTVARNRGNLILRSGPWTYLISERTPNFPDVEGLIPHPGDTGLLAHLSEEDAAQIEELVPQMPGGETTNRLIRLQPEEDLILSAEANGAESRLVLDSSVWLGTMEVLFNRDFLLRAIKIRNRELRFPRGRGPILTEGHDSQYLFMPLTEPDVPEVEEEISPDEDSEQPEAQQETSEELQAEGSADDDEGLAEEEQTDETSAGPIWEDRIAWLEKELAWYAIDYAVDLGVMDPDQANPESDARWARLQRTQKALNQAYKESGRKPEKFPLQPPQSKPKWNELGQFSTADGQALELLCTKEGFFSLRTGDQTNLTREHIAMLLEPLLTNQWKPFTLALYYNDHTWWVDGEHTLERKGKTAKRHLHLTEYRPANTKHLHWEIEVLSHFPNQSKEDLPVPVREKAQARLNQLDRWAHSEPPQTLDLLNLCLKFAKTA